MVDANKLSSWFPPPSIIFKRFILTLIESPHFFLAPLAWEGFALISLNVLNLDKFEPAYCFMTGVGSFLGSIVYSTFLIFISNYSGNDLNAVFSENFLRAVSGGITTGTLWQFSVNISQVYDYDFTGAFFFVFLMSFLGFITSISLIRLLNDCLPVTHRLPLLRLAWSTASYDICLALAIASSDGFFLGTDDFEYRDAWLSDFSVQASFPLSTSLLLAGASGLCGFLTYQSLSNLTLPLGVSWIDDFDRNAKDASEEEEEDRPLFSDDGRED